MARDTLEPPTMENILAMGSMHDSGDEGSAMMNDASMRSHSCSVSGDGLYRVEDAASNDLVNVAIIWKKEDNSIVLIKLNVYYRIENGIATG